MLLLISTEQGGNLETTNSIEAHFETLWNIYCMPNNGILLNGINDTYKKKTEKLKQQYH